MEEIISLILKSFSSVIILFFLSKLMGRKQVGQLNIFDYIIGISIGSIAAEMSLNKDVNFLEGTLSMSIYALVSYFISILTMKSITARRYVIGSPTVIIQNGKILYKNLKKAKMDVNDLLEQARANGYFDLSEIEFSLMESDGKLSFLPKSKYVPLTPNDMKIKTDYKGLSYNLIIDGNIMENNLKNIKKDKKWLLTRLEKKGYNNLNNILLVICDSKEKLTIYEKNIDIQDLKILE